jgi:hypothetical protein
MTSYADNDTTNSTTEATVASTDDTTEEASTNEDTEQPEEPSTEETTEQPTDPGYEQDALNVLFIGNSFTKYDSYKYNVSDMFTNLSESQGNKGYKLWKCILVILCFSNFKICELLQGTTNSPSNRRLGLYNSSGTE